jgi:site-specific DNA-methyltransferase (adenine-specific)
MIAWLYGSGFPKSLDISKAIDKAAGAKREKISDNPNARPMSVGNKSGSLGGGAYAYSSITAPATPEAIKWQGWGTALKPAFEPVVVARKPLIGTVAANVLLWGVGGLNIDGSRIGTEGGGTTCDVRDEEGNCIGHNNANGSLGGGIMRHGQKYSAGRWPANIILDEYTAGLLDEQSGVSKSQVTNFKVKGRSGGILGSDGADRDYIGGHNDTGGASRFFYVAKASKKDRNEGLEDLEERQATEMTGRADGSAGLLRVRDDGSIGENPYAGKSGAAKNFHPTVKPTALMEYLVKLVTPPGGTVLDPFTGSGSTGKAALLNGFKFIGIELTADYLPIIEGRLKHAAETYANKATEEETTEQETLF